MFQRGEGMLRTEAIGALFRGEESTEADLGAFMLGEAIKRYMESK